MPLPSPFRILQRTSFAILTIVVTPVVLMMVATLVCLLAYKRVETNLDEIVAGSIPATQASSDAELALTKMGVATLKAVAVYDLDKRQQYLAEARQQGQRLLAATHRLERLPLPSPGKEKAIAIAEHTPRLVETHLPIWRLLDECTVFATEDAHQLFEQTVPPLHQKVFDSVSEFKAYHKDRVSRQKQSAAQALHTSKLCLLVGNILIAGIGLLLGYLLSRRILTHVAWTLQTLKQVAKGNLEARLNIVSEGEFGEIAAVLNSAIKTSQVTLKQLTDRNRDIQTLLDSVEEGFFTIDKNLTISDERSGAVKRMLTDPGPEETLPDFIRRYDTTVGDWTEFALQEVFEEVMPIEVTLDQVPQRFEHDERTFSIRYTPIRDLSGELKLAVVFRDITTAVHQEQLEVIQREMMSIVHRITEDKSGFLEFFREADHLVKSLQSDSTEDTHLTLRRIHTLKGNASIFGLERLGRICHEIESAVEELHQLPEDGRLERLVACWDSVKEYIDRVIGNNSDQIEVHCKEYNETVISVLNRIPHERIATRMASWRLEPTEIWMKRVKEQAEALAKRMGKGDINVTCTGGDLRLCPDDWSEFWSAFVHVIRNAVDHGLEPPEERVRLEKPESGQIDLSTTIQDDRFVVQLTDDGRGIDWKRIHQLAVQRKLPANTHQQLVEALMFDGVSTRDHVTETSGRGVGMAAVRSSCEKLGGEMQIESALGHGTTITFTFPVDQMATQTIETLRHHGLPEPFRVATGPANVVLDNSLDTPLADGPMLPFNHS
ncbi:ATP-binding protein [Roseiconus lacunae]|uniref:histidine kinase n=1 Tax=Roseiconus lacunae TaxID=2605694 RepID=A0ABT7PEV5_9BACT|nr:ATP-binding protein [Roseiconus lacunae]MDM4015022.1 ATP-binding protein [Roseiconus lacunae]